MSELNSHTHRYLLPWGWEHEKAARGVDLSGLPDSTSTLPYRPVGTSTAHGLWGCREYCRRCNEQWRVWVAKSHNYSDGKIDPGPCYVCDTWLTHEGKVRWDEMSDRYLKNAVRTLTRSCRNSQRFWLTSDWFKHRRKKLHFALTECRYRGILPTQADLMVCWDRAWQLGCVDNLGVCAGAPSFAELWVTFGNDSTWSDDFNAAVERIENNILIGLAVSGNASATSESYDNPILPSMRWPVVCAVRDSLRKRTDWWVDTRAVDGGHFALVVHKERPKPPPHEFADSASHLVDIGFDDPGDPLEPDGFSNHRER